MCVCVCVCVLWAVVCVCVCGGLWGVCVWWAVVCVCVCVCGGLWCVCVCVVGCGVCVCVCVWWAVVCVCGGLWCVCTQSRPTVCGPTLSCQALCPRNFPGKNSGVGLHFLLQGIFLILRSNPRLLRLLKGKASSLPPMPPGKLQNDIGYDINHSIP